LILAVLLGQPYASWADQTASSSEQFASLDQNGDEQLSAGEFTAAKLSLESFQRADSDGNQRLSSEEFNEYQRQQSKGTKRPNSGPHPPWG